jgi:hypothetical protein
MKLYILKPFPITRGNSFLQANIYLKEMHNPENYLHPISIE